MSLDGSLGQYELGAAQAELDINGRLPVVLFTTKTQVVAVRVVRHGISPVKRADQCLQVIGTHAGGIKATDNRAHARAHDGIHRYTHALEFLEYADVRGAACAAATENETDARPR